jgi:hypothetical protein
LRRCVGWFALVGEGEKPEALYELLDPSVEFIAGAGDIQAGRYVGHAGHTREVAGSKPAAPMA